MNHKAIDLGATAYKKIDVPADWADAVDETRPPARGQAELVKQVKDILIPWARWTATACPFPPSASRGRPVRAGRCRLREARRVPSPFPLGRNKCIQCNNCAMSAPTPPSVPSL